MHHEVLNALLIASILLVKASAIGIDGKLDFGNSHSSSASFRSDNTQKNTFVPVKYSKVSKTTDNDDFDNIGVVCVSGGCNTTKSVNKTGNTIQTDVLVHIHTKVDLADNKTTGTVEDTPDIPVVVGYRGSELDTTVDEEDSRNLNPQSIFVPNADPVSIQPTYSSSAGDQPINTYYGSHLPPTVGSRGGSVFTTYNQINPPANYNPSVSSSFTPTITSRVDSVGNQITPSGTFYVTQSDPNVNIKIEPLSSVSGTVPKQDRDNKINTIEVKIPYFEPSYHNHYYGENPPPQVVWYPKRTNTYNPVEFKTVKSPSWTPSVWNNKVSPHHRHHATSTTGSGVQCTCKEVQKTPGVRWYPNTSRGTINDPGSQINDKLAPLN